MKCLDGDSEIDDLFRREIEALRFVIFFLDSANAPRCSVEEDCDPRRRTAIAPLTDSSATEFRFSKQEEETLAIAEHDRWVKERRSSGWTLGDRDPEQKKSPYLVPFADLPPEIADYDRLFIREIPSLLASAGLRAVRLSPD